VIYAKLFNAKIVYDYVERFTSFEDRKSKITSRFINDFFENFMMKYNDGIFVISEHLKEIIKEKAPGVPMLKLPGVSDFDIIDRISPKKLDYKYILYCGSIGYIDVVYFIINAYLKSRITSKIKLVLIVNGDHVKIKKLYDEFQNKDNIVILTKLSYEDLIGYYKSAEGLLIPLRNTIQDVARFPHKVSEYTAVKGLILSTNFGEVRKYFNDGENAILVKEYDEGLFAELIDYAINKCDNCNDIKMGSYRTGLENFSVQSNSIVLNEFLKELI
jgi:glycosyltransferase involved in cell wall biosynthesis